jgi:hypothetical protein
MSQHGSPHLDAVTERFWPAWLFSLVFHSSAIVVMGLLIQAAPRAPEAPGNSTTMVLQTTSAEGDGADDDDDGGESPAPIAPQLRPDELLSVEPIEPPPVVVESQPPEMPLIQPPAPPPRATAFTGNGQTNATRFNAAGGSGRGTSGGRGTARVSVFGVQGEGKKFVYLFDRSASMEGTPLAAAKRQLIDSLGSLEDIHQFQIVFFNTRAHPFEVAEGGRRIAFATDRNKQLAARFVGGITADGGTDRITALKTALALAPDVIFFLTDADDPMSPGELSEIARDNRRATAAICTIEFGRRHSPSPGSFLAELARQSGGQYGYVNTATLGQ